MESAVDTSSYAWIIDVDHLSGELAGEGDSEAGTTGPSNAPISKTALPFPNLCDQELRQHYRRANQFRMYDDDGELYYTGTLYFDDEPGDEECMGPLRDFGMPNAGAVTIEYTNHHEWDCG